MNKTQFIPFMCVLIFCLSDSLFAQQTEITGQIRPRYEMRNGYQTLKPDGSQVSHFISQRARLNLKFTNDLLNVGFSIQNIGVWGESPTMRLSDVNGTMIFEAWGALNISKKVSLKVGRQVISYDDQRIFGGVDWAQQARSHDAAVLMLRPREGCSLDLGFAYNAMKQDNFREYYTVNSYKAMQFVHWHRNISNFGISILLLNNGLPWINVSDTTESGDPREKIAYSQTMGTRVTYKKEKFTSNAAFYYQMGKVTRDTTSDGMMESTVDIAGLYFGFDMAYQFSENYSAGAGIEYFSGNSMKDPPDRDEAFKPLFGTNHKFNGLMDYFYVGNHFNAVGLFDIFIPLKYKRNKFTATFIPHFFQSTADIYGSDRDGNMKDFSNWLGTELDFVFGYAIAKNATVSAGYSQLFATESMQVFKGGNHKNTNNWAWVMIDFKPTFFKSDKK